MKKPVRIAGSIFGTMALILFLGFLYTDALKCGGWSYESSDRGFWDTEIPSKKRSLEEVEFYFEQYKAGKADASLRLCRTSTRSWINPLYWYDNLTNARWSLPYLTPSDISRFRAAVPGQP